MRRTTTTIAITLAVLLFCQLVARAQLSILPFLLVREDGAPFVVTHAAPYLQTRTLGSLTLDRHPLVCVSFTAGDRELHSVTISLAHIRADGSASEAATIKRDGVFSPGVPIQGYEGQEVRGGGDRHALANCTEFSVAIGGIDIVRSEIRPIAATFADGTTWTTSRPVPVVPTPVPIGDDHPPAWDEEHHSGYLAVASNGGSILHPVSQKVYVYAPGHRAPSSTIDFGPCCIDDVKFTARGDLLVAAHDGVRLVRIGSKNSELIHPEHGVLALAPGGALAISAPWRQGGVTVYPSGGAQAYRIDIAAAGSAFLPNGDLALIDRKTSTLGIYAPGAVTPKRTVTLDGPAPLSIQPFPYAISVDRSGKIAIARRSPDVRATIYSPDDLAPLTSVPGGHDLAFDGAGHLIVLSPTNTSIYDITGKLISSQPVSAFNVIADPNSTRYAVLDIPRKQIVDHATDGTDTIIPIADLSREFTLSP